MAVMSTGNPPRLVLSSVGGGPRWWMHSSSIAIATIEGSSYFSKGGQYGMSKGDLVWVYDSTNHLWSVVNVISTSTNGSVHTSSHTAIGKASS